MASQIFQELYADTNQAFCGRDLPWKLNLKAMRRLMLSLGEGDRSQAARVSLRHVM